MPSENRKKKNIGKWLALGDKNQAFRIFYSVESLAVAVTDTFLITCWRLVEIFIAYWFQRIHISTPGNASSKMKIYKNYLLPAMDIPNIHWYVCIRMLDISASIKLECEHRNHPTCQRFGQDTSSFFPPPCGTYHFCMCSMMMPQQLTKWFPTHKLNCQTILKIWAALVCWNMLESILAKEAT